MDHQVNKKNDLGVVNDDNSEELIDEWMQELHTQYPSASIQVVVDEFPTTSAPGKSNDVPNSSRCFTEHFQEEHSYSISPIKSKDSTVSVPGCSKYLEERPIPEYLKNNDNCNKNINDVMPYTQESETSSVDDNLLEVENYEQNIPVNNVIIEEPGSSAEPKEPVNMDNAEGVEEPQNGLILGRLKRKRNKRGSKDLWFDNKNKHLRQHGKEYVGWSKQDSGKAKRGAEKKSRALKPRCQGPGCLKSFRTCNNISDNDRETLFNDFWENLEWNQKQTYIASLVKRVDKKTARNPEAGSRRNSTINYSIRTPDGKLHSVCKTFFLNTFDLGEWTVREWAANSTKEVEPGNIQTGHGITPPKIHRPKRGLGDTNPRGKAKLIEFFDSLPKLPSHYCRKDTSKVYVEPIFGNRLSDVYAEYRRQCTDEAEPPIKPLSQFTFYKMAESLNVGFQAPKKDRCDTCVAHDAGLVSEEDYAVHKSLKDRARKEKDLDKEKAIQGTQFVLTQDVQAVKVCPSLNASALYFKTKLACHNFSVYDLNTHDARCYWFNETQADLTAPTFASCLIQYLEDKWDKTSKLPIVIWSDGCTCQNRNAIMANALLSFSEEYGVMVTQKFLEKGHTQMEVDSIHSEIERKLHNQPIHLPSDFVRISANARANPTPIEQRELTFDFVTNFSQPDLQVYESIRPGRKPGDPVVTDIKEIQYNNGSIKVKIRSFDSPLIDIPQRKKRSAPAKLSEFKPKHSAPLKITKSKWNHLQELKSVLPLDCHPYYDSIKFE